MVFADLDIKFNIADILFYVPNISYERITGPIPMHRHGGGSYEFHYVHKGNGALVTPDATYSLKSNSLYMTGPLIDHEQYSYENDYVYEFCIYFKLKKPYKKTNHPLLTVFEDKKFWIGEAGSDIPVLMDKLLFELSNHRIGFDISVQNLLSLILVSLVRSYDESLQPVNTFQKSNLFDSKYLISERIFLNEYQTITLMELSTRLGLSTRQTERLLNEYSGKSFSRLKSEARMSCAITLLHTTDLNITEIAFQIGYASVEHFSYAFKKRYGLSPKAYRRQ